ncbi:phenylalanine N-monooxygenase-like protein [Perilla frutescens var. hirtella]|uniref:Phenylalanine N-monooxygenase-like protein n=1 Tax=Perilla frutescens var. hirtella TaxID=608512 RepID=A0AAD4ISK3_PERFH|nr:phenylalanine N-monooxygenase-like protein [Perilla frutescens var. hirtella]
MNLLSLLIALGFATTIFYKWMKLHKSKRSRLPPGPTTEYPLLGSLPEFVKNKNKPTFRWIHKLMQEMDTEIACIRLGNTHVIPVTSPQLACEFLKKQDSIFASRPDVLSARVPSHGYLATIFSPSGDQWKKMRKVMVAEVLSAANHRWLHPKRCAEADHLVRYVYKQCQNPLKEGLVNVRDAAQHYCGNLIRKLVFNKRFFGPGSGDDGGPGIEEREHVGAVFTILFHLYAFSVADYYPWMEVFDFDGHKRIITEAVNVVRKYHDPEIEKRAEMWRRGVREREEDILDVLVNLKDSQNNNPLLSIHEIKAQLIEITLAGIDNPSNAVEWAMAEMINQPNILAKACEELDRVVGKNRLVQESDLPELNYVKACVKEAFRLHPIAPFNPPHLSTEDTVVGGYFIPKGSHVLLSRPGLGRNPRVWEDPLTYKPERHVADGVSEVMLVDNELRMLSFSTGRRGCPGVLLGSTMATILLARLVQGFSWKTPPNEPRIKLVESRGNMLLAEPLIAQAMPRLEPQVYIEIM